MNTLSPLGNSRFLPQKLNDVLRAFDATPIQHSSSHQHGIEAGNEDVVTLSDAGLSLSKRAEELGNATINVAQNLLASFAKQIFGNRADGLNISFDSASISAASQFSSTVQHSESANGILDAAAFQMQEGADFVGSGEITTADGQRYRFEIEVHYQLRVEGAAVSQTSTLPVSQQNNTTSRKPEQNFNNLRAQFGGSNAELARLFENDTLKLFFKLPQTLAGAQKAHEGMMTLQLLDRLDVAPLKAMDNDANIKSAPPSAD